MLRHAAFAAEGNSGCEMGARMALAYGAELTRFSPLEFVEPPIFAVSKRRRDTTAVVSGSASRSAFSSSSIGSVSIRPRGM